MPRKPSDLSILLVDDAELITKTVRAMLRDMGFKAIFVAGDGAQAWETLSRAEMDLVICDWNMPKLSGLDLLKRIRETPRLEKLPFIMLTAEAEEQAVHEAVRAGVTDYVVKPFTKDTIMRKLTKLLGL